MSTVPPFLSDSLTRACPEVLAAMAAANDPDLPYDDDRLSRDLDRVFSDLFETPVAALWALSGTAANGLAIAATTNPGDGILCHAVSHINTDEAGAPEFFGYGAKILPMGGADGRLDPDDLATVLAQRWRAVHRTQPALVSITNATEWGRVYRPDEVSAIGAVAHREGLLVHMDGARFANAVAGTGSSPADLTWRAGVDVLSFGFTKNGGVCADAVIFFDPVRAEVARVRRKRSGHLPSKGRFLAAQLHAMLEGGLWRRNGAAANERARALAGEVAHLLACPVEANMVLLRLDADQQRALGRAGYTFHTIEPGVLRVVMSYDQPYEKVEALGAVLRAL